MYYKATPDSNTYKKVSGIMARGKQCHLQAQSLCLELFDSDKILTTSNYIGGDVSGVYLEKPGPEMKPVPGQYGYYMPRTSVKFPEGKEAQKKINALEKVSSSELSEALNHKFLGCPGIILDEQFLLIHWSIKNYGSYTAPDDCIEIVGSEYLMLKAENYNRTKEPVV